jgi:hypothetical protein
VVSRKKPRPSVVAVVESIDVETTAPETGFLKHVIMSSTPSGHDVPNVAVAKTIPETRTGPFFCWGVQRTGWPSTALYTPTQNRVVEGSYFEAVGIPVLRGRTFGPQDTADAPRRVVVSQQLVRELFPSEDPIGKALRVAAPEPAEIIGVVGDVALGARLAPRPDVYHSHSQFAGNRTWALTQVVALDRERPSIAADVRRELAQIDPALVVYEPTTMLEDVIAGGVSQERFALGTRGELCAACDGARGDRRVRRAELFGEPPQP